MHYLPQQPPTDAIGNEEYIRGLKSQLGDNVTVEDIGSLALKGLMQPVVAYNVPLAAGQPALRVVEGGPQRI